MSSRISQLAKRVKEHPDDSFTKFALALELLKTGDIQKPRLLFEHIAEQDPQYVGVYYHLGGLYTQLNENKKAVSTYKKGIDVAQSVGDTHAKAELMGALTNLELELDQ